MKRERIIIRKPRSKIIFFVKKIIPLLIYKRKSRKNKIMTIIL